MRELAMACEPLRRYLVYTGRGGGRITLGSETGGQRDCYVGYYDCVTVSPGRVSSDRVKSCYFVSLASDMLNTFEFAK